jgi:hypothetical membrane protein
MMAAASLAGVAVFIVTVIGLHWLQPDYQPVHQLMSELALGPHGWAMIFAFCGLALAMFGIQAAIGPLQASRSLRVILGLAALLFVAAGVFTLQNAAEVHIAAIAAAFITSVLAMYLFPSGAGRAAFAASRAISWSLAAGVAASVVLGHSVLPMGVGQRLAAACLLLWLGIVSWQLLRRPGVRDVA